MIEIIKNEIKRFESLNKDLFKDIDKVYDELLNLDNYEYILDDDDFEDDEKEYMVEDFVSVLCIRLYGSDLIDNLIKCGWDFKDEYWCKDNKELSNYGIIWDYYIDLDTCVRERVSEELDRIMEERNMM